MMKSPVLAFGFTFLNLAIIQTSRQYAEACGGY